MNACPPLEKLHRTISTWREFNTCWGGLQNFLMDGECVPFNYEMPSIEQVVEVVRADADVQVTSGAKGDSLTGDDAAKEFRDKPIEQALQAQFGLAHYRLKNFD